MTVDVAEVFRTEWPRVVAVLVRDFGDLDLAEECAQDAFVEASRRWTVEAIPDQPTAWLITTARRKAIDQLRRNSTYATKLSELEARAKSVHVRSGGELIDEQLALLLGCCHPALNQDAQVALTLRVVAGLTTEQIAAAFLVESATMGKRLTRAKAKIRKANIPFRPVGRDVLEERLRSVQQVIYLIFTEGHASRSDASFVRGDLCDEAAWLAGLLARLVGDTESHALLALILLTDARRATRVDDAGTPILLEDQDRTLWDRVKIARGLEHLAEAEVLGLGPVGLQAKVASFHAVAASFDQTLWPAIVSVYDQMIEAGGGPVIELNRAAALSYVHGPAAALAQLDPLAPELEDYVYFHSARAELLRRMGFTDDARQAYERALACEPSAGERAFLTSQLDTL